VGFLIFRKELIIIATKLLSSVTYIATGTQTTFTIPFDYLRKTFIHVVVDDEEITDGVSVEDRTIVFTTAPTKDATVTIYRSTPTERLVAWGDATILKARDMTISEVQQLHIIEESQDWSKSNSITLNDGETAWQGRGYPLSNVADPTDTQDVVTKNYLENVKDSFTITMNGIKTATQQYVDEAKANVTNYASNAATSATNAGNSAANAETSATNAKTYATNAASSATAAATSAINASSSATAAQSASSTSSNFATSARSSANEALTYRNNASTYADNAKTYMETAKDYSENVNVFVPSVSSDGVISWTNKAGLTNPSPVSVKGATGEAGKAATIAIGTVTTGEAGTSVSVTNSGTTSAAVFNFVIPKGKDVTVDSALSSTSTNPVQNKVINTALNKKANTSSLAAVATSGSYNDLTNTPSLATVATSGSYNDLTNTPSLATVATSGSYNDLTDTPTISSASTSLPYAICSSAKSTAAKVATVITGSFSKEDGALVTVKFTYSGTVSYPYTTPTLNVNSTGAYSMLSDKFTSYTIPPIALFLYLASRWYAIEAGNISSSYDDYGGDGG